MQPMTLPTHVRRYSWSTLLAAMVASGVVAPVFSSDASAQPVNWSHITSARSELPVPPASDGQSGMRVVDLDSDGQTDYIITLWQGQSIVWFRRVGDTFQQYIIEPDSLGLSHGERFADIDRDGDIDLIFGQASTGNDIYWWENPYPNYSPATRWKRRIVRNAGGNMYHDNIWGDFDGDGTDEFISWNQHAKQVLLFEVPADPRTSGQWPAQQIFSWADQPELEYRGIAAADINLDGVEDLVGGGGWFEHTGTGFVFHQIDPLMRSGRQIAGQFIAGGRPEIVAVQELADGPLNLYVWTGTQWETRALISHVSRAHTLELGDINGDGHLDLLFGEMGMAHRLPVENPDAVTLVLYGDGAGNFTRQTVFVGQGTLEGKLADIDNDGDLDIVGNTFRHNAPRMDIWINGGFAPVILPQGGAHVGHAVVSLSNEAGGTIYYTTDGSQPNLASQRYSGPFVLNTTASVNAVTVLNGELLPGVSAAFFEIAPDGVRPSIVSAYATLNPARITVRFSEPVERTQAESTANYSVTGGVTITAAVLDDSLRTVILETSTLVDNVQYVLTVNNIADVSASRNTIIAGSRYEFRTYSLPADSALWLRADAGTVPNGPFVSRWNDASGNSRPAAQPLLFAQPLHTDGVVNGLPVLRFDGVNDFLRFALPVNGLNGLSIFLVAANTANQTGGTPRSERAAIYWNQSSSWGMVYLSPFPSAVNFRFGTGQTSNNLVYTRPSSVGASFTLTAAVKNGSTDSLFVNGQLVLKQTGRLSTIALTHDFGDLARGYNDSTFYTGDIAEVVVYTRALSTEERQAVERYLDAKYALGSALPPPEAGTITTAVVGSGTVTKTPDQASYAFGEVVQLQATPAAGWTFAGWSGALTGTANPTTLTVAGDHSVTATFTQDQQTTGTVTTAVTGFGSITKTPDQASYAIGDAVQLEAIAAADWTFAGWSGALSGAANPATLTVSGDHSVTATFVQNGPSPAGPPVSDDFSGGGLNTSLWKIVNPVGDASASVSAGALRLGVPAGVDHDVWTGGNRAVRVMQPVADTDLDIQVKFDSTVTLKYQMQGLLVEQEPGTFLRFNVHSDGSSVRAFAASFAAGKPTTRINQTIAAGSRYFLRVQRAGTQWTLRYSYDGASWTTAGSFSQALITREVGIFAGNSQGSTSPAFTAVADYFLNAQTDAPPSTGTVTTTAVGSGSVSKNPAQASYAIGDVVQLEATPAAGWTFAGWSGAVTGTASPISLTVSGDHTVTATFTETPPPGGGGAAFVSDDFNACALDEGIGGWTFFDPLGGATRRIVGAGTGESWLEIAVPGGIVHDPWNGNYTIPRAMRAIANTDFEIEVKFLSNVTLNAQIQGILIEQDAANYVRFDFHSKGAGLRIFAASTSGGVSTSRSNKSITAGVPQYMRITRIGDKWTQRYSYDGITWKAAVTFSHALTAIKAGVFAGNAGTNPPAHTAQIDYAFNTAAPVVPEDGAPAGETYSLTTSVSGSGSVARDPDQPAYACGTSVTLTATAEPGWKFSMWTGDVLGNINPITVTATQDKAVTGEFVVNVPPAISGITIAPGDTWVTASWQTDEPATTTVTYGTTASYELGAWTDTSLVTQHTMLVTGLSPGTTYHLQLSSQDTDGGASSTPDYVTTTSQVFPLEILNIQVTPDDVSAYVTWQTNKPATSLLQYGTTPAYGLGSISGRTLTQTHAVAVGGLSQGTEYHYAISVADEAGLSAGSGDRTFTTTLIAPLVTAWYGDYQRFGHLGVPQRWVNILGNVQDPDGVKSLQFSLNGGPLRKLSIGPDTRRLVAPGDFNVELDYAEMNPGVNDVRIFATDNLGHIAEKPITAEVMKGLAWPVPYSIDWGSVSRIEDAAQVVDGRWTLDSGAVRSIAPGYDRLIDLGDVIWTNYEVTATITINSVDPAGYAWPSNGPAVGLGLRWSGHSVWDTAQPSTGYWPLGALAWYRWKTDGTEQLQLLGNWLDKKHLDTSGLRLDLGRRYTFKARVQTEADGQHLYQFKVWAAADPEPAGWRLQVRNGNLTDDPTRGSVLLLAHWVDASFRDVTVVPIP